MTDIKVEMIDHMGSDLDVVNAARVSFDKESEWGYGENWKGVLNYGDRKLIEYLAEHNHWSPFTHCFLKFRVKAPIFVARQLAKHQVGLSWNEVSRRYVDSDPEFYEPKAWRKRADNVKQGSSGEEVKLYDIPKGAVSLQTSLNIVSDLQVDAYRSLLEAGICPEQARMVLPQSMMTEWIWSGSLYAFARVVNQRLDSHAQVECREVAKHISEHLERLFPVSWSALAVK